MTDETPASDRPQGATDAGVSRRFRSVSWRRLRLALTPRATLSQAVVGLLFVALGFAFALQVRSTQSDNLSTARPTDLIRILDDLNARNDRLQEEARDLSATRDALLTGSDKAATALQESTQRAETLGVLAGTLAATGPGVELVISDPTRGVDAATLLDTIEELRDAGAEAIQINSVRVVASTYFVDRPTGVSVDGQALTSPYKITAIGDPRTIAAALRIPGGVVETIRGVGGDVTIDERNSVTVSVLHAPKTPQYARPAS